MRNENHRIGINNQKQPWKGVLNIEWKKLLNDTTWKGQFPVQFSETLLKQISLCVFLNYCTNILVVGFVYFLSDFSRSRSSDLKAFRKKNLFLKNVRIQKKKSCASLLLKLQNVLKKRLWHRSFSVNFTKFLRNVL